MPLTSRFLGLVNDREVWDHLVMNIVVGGSGSNRVHFPMICFYFVLEVVSVVSQLGPWIA